MNDMGWSLTLMLNCLNYVVTITFTPVTADESLMPSKRILFVTSLTLPMLLTIFKYNKIELPRGNRKGNESIMYLQV